jgi:aryl-alcohol dehydrogenase-like predicted oxidoreductase
MKYRLLPGTQLNVSEVCLGTMTWGEQNSEADGHAQLDYAVAQGSISSTPRRCIRCRPTRPRRAAPRRSSARGWHADRAATSSSRPKVAGPGRREWIRGGRTDLTRDVIADAVDTSLARLQIDCIDLYQIHWPQRNVPLFGATEFDPAKENPGPSISEQVEGMAAMIRAGKIRHYGLSNETAWGVCEFHRAAKSLGLPGPVTVQNSYSLVSRSVDNDLAEALYREGMTLLAYSPLAAGMLSGKYMGGARPPEARLTRFDGMGMRFRKPIVHEGDRRVCGACRATRHVPGAAGAGIRANPMVPGRSDHRCDVAWPARGGHRRRANGTRRRDSGGDRGDPDPLSQSGGLTLYSISPPNLPFIISQETTTMTRPKAARKPRKAHSRVPPPHRLREHWRPPRTGWIAPSPPQKG